MTKISSTVGARTLRARMQEGIVAVPEATLILRALLGAMAAEMRAGVADGGRLRTITPEGVRLAANGQVSLAGAGAHASGEDARERREIESAYCAPEVTVGEGGAGDESLVYSWGAVAYELLVGVPPFATSHDAEALTLAHARELPVPIEVRRSGIPPALAGAIGRCLAKDPRDRPSIGLLLDLLAESAPPVPRVPRRSHRAYLWGGLAAVGVLLLALVLLVRWVVAR